MWNINYLVRAGKVLNDGQGRSHFWPQVSVDELLTGYGQNIWPKLWLFPLYFERISGPKCGFQRQHLHLQKKIQFFLLGVDCRQKLLPMIAYNPYLVFYVPLLLSNQNEMFTKNHFLEYLQNWPSNSNYEFSKFGLSWTKMELAITIGSF